MQRQFALGYFPSGDPDTHLRSLPYARALGLQWENGNGACVRVRLPYSSSVRAADRAAIDSLATLGLLDHICSAAVYSSLDRPKLIATLDLRVEFADDPQSEGDIVAQAQTTYIDGAFSLVRAEAVCARSGRRVAYASSAYALGVHPGMRGNTTETTVQKCEAGPGQPETHDGFLRMLGLQNSVQGFVLPFDRRLIGAISLPSLHGGATGAAMAAAAAEEARKGVDGNAPSRALTLAIQYLRAAGAAPVLMQTRVLKRGFRASVISVIAEQGTPAQTVAQAECLFVRPDAAAARQKQR